MNMDFLKILEALPGWTPFRELTTKSGPLLVSETPMTPKAWDLWNNNVSRAAMQKVGFAVRKAKDGQHFLVRAKTWMAPEVKKALVEESRAASVDDNLMIAPGQKYLEFQKAGIKYAMDRLFGQNGQQQRDAVLIGDGMGLGKTVQAIGVLNQDPSLHTLRALVICPASLKINWRNEMRKFLMDGIGHDAVVIQKKWPGGLVPPRIAIVNYDVIHKFHDELCATKWDYLIFDEAHYLKNETTRWTVYALGGMRKEGEHELYTQGVDGKYTLFLTGTPIPNRVKEAWPIVKRCDPHGLGASYPAFYARYCKSNENLAELQERMRVGFMVRRTKEEVFKDFPAKIRSVFCIDPAECHGINVNLFREEMSIFKEYQEMLQSWQARAEIAKAEGIEAYKDVQKEKKERLGIKASELAKLRMKTAIAKAPAVADRVAEHAQGGAAKVLVFGHHREVLNLIEEGCKKHGLRVRQINGDTPKDESPEGRQGLVDAYQRGELDVMVLGYKPGGVGLTLTKASVVVMAEPDYVPGNMTQAEDRAHRIGLDHPILVEHDVLEGSLDEFMARILIEKQDTILRALDFNEDEDLEETQETWAVKERAATQGVSAQKIEEESLRMTSTMRKIADEAAGRLLAMAVGLKNVDREILEGLRSITNTRNRAAMHRRFALKYRDLVPDAVEDLKWKIEPLPGTKTSM